MIRITLTTAFLLAVNSTLFAEQHSLTLTTYYPAPSGAYDRLLLVPRDTIPGDQGNDGRCTIGTLYTAKDQGLKFCKDDGAGHGFWGEITSSIDLLFAMARQVNEELANLKNVTKELDKKIENWANTLSAEIGKFRAENENLKSTVDMQQGQIDELRSELGALRSQMASCCR